MELKTVRLGQIKAGPEAGLKAGEMIAYASVFGNVDSYGDVVAKGAFAGSLKWWKDSGRTLPLLYGHNIHDPNMNIGEVFRAEEDERGLKIWARFDDDDTAQKVYRLVKAGRLAELSFAFDAVKWAALDDDDRPNAYRELQELKLYECSVVPIGANSETEVLAIKSAADGALGVASAVADGLKAGRKLSKANETSLREVAASLSAAKAALDKVLPDEEEPEDEEPDEVEDDDTGDDDDDKTKGSGVESGQTQGPSSGTGPALGDEIKELFTSLVEDYLKTMISPPSKSSPSPSDPLVAEVMLLELGRPE